MAVASLRYLDVGVVGRRSQLAKAVGVGASACETLVVGISGVGRSEVVDQLLEVELAVELIHLGQFGLELLLIALREASHDIKLIESAFVLGLHKLENGVDALLACVLDEATRVDNRDLSLRTLGVVHAVVTVVLKQAHELFRVDEVLGAPHRDDIYLIFLHFWC